MVPKRAVTLARLLLIVALAVPTGACSSFTNLFNKEEAVAPDEPPEKLYNEGVFLLDRRQEYKDAAKEVRRGRAPASVFGMGAQGAADDGLMPITKPRNMTSRCLRHGAM